MEKSEEIQWLNTILNESEKSSPEKNKYICQPSNSNPEFILPIDNPKVSKTAVYRFSNGKNLKNKLKILTASFLARSGALKHFPKQISKSHPVHLPEWDLTQYLQARLNEKKLYTAITLGPHRRNRKPIIQLIRPNGESVGFVKIGWSKLTKKMVENEAKILKEIEQKLDKKIQIPKVILAESWNDQSLVVLSTLQTSFFSSKKITIDDYIFTTIYSCLGIENKQIVDLPILNKTELEPYIDIGKLRTDYGNDTVKLGLWHGDLTPWNMCTRDKVVSIWDWELAANSKPIGFDNLHSQFEQFRRDPNYTSIDALRSTHKMSSEILGKVGQKTDPVYLLYICELILRELNLQNQKWGAPKKIEIINDLKLHAEELGY